MNITRKFLKSLKVKNYFDVPIGRLNNIDHCCVYFSSLDCMLKDVFEINKEKLIIYVEEEGDERTYDDGVNIEFNFIKDVDVIKLLFLEYVFSYRCV